MGAGRRHFHKYTASSVSNGSTTAAFAARAPPLEEESVRSLRVAASWQQGLPAPGSGQAASAWRYLAACSDCDPDLFFPVGSSAPALQQVRRAKAVCERCPVRFECLEWALETDQPHGVWGGLDEIERQHLQRRRGGASTTADTFGQVDGALHAVADDPESEFGPPLARPA